MNKEPAVIIGAMTSVATGVYIYLTGDPGVSLPDWVTTALPLVGGLLTRWRVFSPATVANLGR